jgi:chromosome segregation ATPase
MPYCPTHGEKTGRFCPDCGTELIADESVSIRGAKAVATANPTFVLPGGHVETRPPLVKCPKCGKRNLEPATFDCQGDCGRQNLCLRHFDEDYEVCIDCARTLRGEAQADAERQAQVQSDLTTWRQRAEQADAQVNELTRQDLQTQRALKQAQTELRLAQERVQSLEQELAGQRQRAEQAEAQVAELTRQGHQAGNDLDQARADLSETQERVRSLEQEFTTQRLLAGKAEADVAALSQAQERAGELEKLRALNERLRSDYAGLLAQFGQTQQERDSYKATLATATRALDTAQSKLAASTDQLANKEVALNEAYLRVVKLQRELMDHQSMLAATQSELAEQRRDMASLASLTSYAGATSRGEIAGELALLTSTMLRMKEEQLRRANEQLQRLQQELDDLRQNKD